MTRKATCKNCNRPIFRYFTRGWFHAPHGWYCAVQQAVGYHPYAQPKA